MASPRPPPRAADLSNAVAARLKAMIHAGEFGPGDRLNEAALALLMGTSRGPIREAIKVLAGLGLVTAIPNRGVFVRQLSMREMGEIYELRALVFGYAAHQACERATRGDARRFGRMLSLMDAACDAGDGARYYELNLQFHALVMDVAGNRRAIRAYDDYVKELHFVRRRYFDGPGNMRRSNLEHRAIHEAIAAGDALRARAAAEQHVLSGRIRLLSSLDAPPEVPDPSR
ncbi:MAG: GntR family transcriptional regulator [Lautropia sp.]